jgi:hypothetical protein
MTTAIIDAYFAKPPEAHLMIQPDGSEVLASPNPWRWDSGFGLFINERTGTTMAWVGPGKPRGKATDPKYDPRTINAEVHVQQVEADWAASGIGLEGHTAKTIYVDGVAKRLRGDGDEWRRKQKHLRREEQLFRARNFRPNKVDTKPSDHMIEADRKRFFELAKEAAANICHLATFLPYVQIKGPRLMQRLLEMVERELISDEEAGKKTAREIEAEFRALGGGVEEITNTKIERLQRRLVGMRFQYYFDQLLFKAWREQYDEVCGEHEALAASLPGVEFDGKTWSYTNLRDRVERRKKLAKETEKAVQVQLAMLKGSSEQDYYKWLERKTGYKPRNSGYFSAARPEVAQPIYEADFGDEDE